jgi:hypothetical protein
MIDQRIDLYRHHRQIARKIVMGWDDPEGLKVWLVAGEKGATREKLLAGFASPAEGSWKRDP